MPVFFISFSFFFGNRTPHFVLWMSDGCCVIFVHCFTLLLSAYTYLGMRYGVCAKKKNSACIHSVRMVCLWMCALYFFKMFLLVLFCCLGGCNLIYCEVFLLVCVCLCVSMFTQRGMCMVRCTHKMCIVYLVFIRLFLIVVALSINGLWICASLVVFLLLGFNYNWVSENIWFVVVFLLGGRAASICDEVRVRLRNSSDLFNTRSCAFIPYWPWNFCAKPQTSIPQVKDK